MWLNEGFARFANILVQMLVRPTWRAVSRNYFYLKILYNSNLDFVYRTYSSTDSMNYCFRLSNRTQAISQDLFRLMSKTPEEIDNNINPTITYGKVRDLLYCTLINEINIKITQKFLGRCHS